MNNKEIIELYDLYGFSLEKELEDAVIFSYSNGYFNNIEIIYNNDKKINQYKKVFDNDKDSLKHFFRINREEFVFQLSSKRISSLPKTIDNIVYISNTMFVHNEKIYSFTPEIIKSKLSLD